MKKLVIIGANDFQNQLILKAKSLGYETHVLLGRKEQLEKVQLITFILSVLWRKKKYWINASRLNLTAFAQ